MVVKWHDGNSRQEMGVGAVSMGLVAPSRSCAQVLRRSRRLGRARISWIAIYCEAEVRIRSSVD
jgi:hypothetical protein